MKTSFLVNGSVTGAVKEKCEHWGVGVERVFNSFLYASMQGEMEEAQKEVSSNRKTVCLVIDGFLFDRVEGYCKEKGIMRSRFFRAVYGRILSAGPDTIFRNLQAYAIEKKIQEALNG